MKRRAYLPLVALMMTSLVVTGCFNKKETIEEDVSGDEVATEIQTQVQDQNEPVIDPNMVAGTGSKVRVHYIGRLKGEEDLSQEDVIAQCAEYDIFDTSYESVARACGKFNPHRDYTQPLELIIGGNMFIPKFEKSIIGRKAGDKFSVFIPSAEAYGEWSATKTIEVPLAQLPPKNPVGTGENMTSDPYVAGDEIQINGGMSIKIVAIEGENAKIDGNHPLAGKDLIFDMEVVSVEEGDSLALTESMVKSIEEVAQESIETTEETTKEISTQ